jgi:hypothetical protein
MDTSFHASENDFICEDCGKCLKSGLGRHRLRKHLKQEIQFECATASCTAAFCEKRGGGDWFIRPAMVNKTLMWVNLVKNSFCNCTHNVMVYTL